MGAIKTTAISPDSVASRISAPRGAGLRLRRSWPSWGRWLDERLWAGVDAGSESACKLLMALGADPCSEFLPGQSLVSRWARSGRVEMLAWAGGCGAERLAARGPHGWGAAHHAAAKGHADILLALGRWGLSLRERSLEGFTPLIVACRENRPEAVAALCARLGGAGSEKGACALNEADDGGNRPLTICAAKGFDEPARLLLRAGADPSLPNGRGFGSLHLAARSGHAEICRLLIARGADPAAAGPWGKTPAFLARDEGHREALAAVEEALLLRLTEPPPASGQGPRRL